MCVLTKCTVRSRAVAVAERVKRREAGHRQIDIDVRRGCVGGAAE